MTQRYYEKEFKREIVRSKTAHRKGSNDKKFIKRIWSIKTWCREFSKECQNIAKKDTTAKNELELMKENRRLQEKISEYEKEVRFLKKRRHSL